MINSFFKSYNTKGNSPFYQEQTPFGQTQFQSLPKNTQKKERAEINSLIAIGDPIVDITSEIDTEIIKKYNMKWGDTVFLDEKSAFFCKNLLTLHCFRAIVC